MSNNYYPMVPAASLDPNQNTHHADSDIYYTPQTLADRWGCSKDIVYDLLKSGKLHGFKLGRDWRISDTARIAYETASENCATKQYNFRTRTKAPCNLRVV